MTVMQARIFETKSGWAAVASSGQGISQVLMPSKSRAKIERELEKLCSGEYEVGKNLIRVESDIIRYFNGRFVDFSQYPIDMTFSTGFDKTVWLAIKDIPYGKTMTYKEVAEKIGNPNASRAVANALNHNPIPLLLPCHRILASDGIGGYSAGVALKKKMLQLEGII